MPKEDNARQGFVEDAQFGRLTAEAKELWLRTFLELAYSYGWRRSELLGLASGRWTCGHARSGLTPATKNGDGREVARTSKVEELLRAAVAGKGKADYVLTRESGKPVKEFRGAWKKLCTLPGSQNCWCTISVAALPRLCAVPAFRRP